MGILFLIGAAYIADKLSRPILVACIFTILTSALSLIESEPFIMVLMSAAITFVFCSIYFSLLVKYTGQILIWLMILLGFPLALFFLPLLADTA